MGKSRGLGVGAVLAVVTVLALAFVVLFAMTARGAGVEEPWSQEMNHESYWEARFGAECTKYENHYRFIPAEYDIAIVHDGQMVAIYNPAPDNEVVASPTNPANGKPYQEPGEPSSWVMKCKMTQETTTTTEAPTTTTTEGVTSTTAATDTTTTPEDTTTTSVPVSSSTSTPSTSTPTTTPDSIPSDPAELPYTGAGGIAGLTLLGMALMAGGVALVRKYRPA